jgi:hypothetical protein
MRFIQILEDLLEGHALFKKYSQSHASLSLTLTLTKKNHLNTEEIGSLYFL